jgi:hypothetical protein
VAFVSSAELLVYLALEFWKCSTMFSVVPHCVV